MKKYLLLPVLTLLFSFAFSQQNTRGQLLGFQLLDSLDLQEIQQLYNGVGLPSFLAPIKYSVEAYKLTYLTPAAKGDTLTTASGLILVPQNSELCFPMYNYNHGTSFYGEEISALGPEWFLGLPFATGGYVMVMPDYLGYGDTPPSHPHPYIHSKTEASATIDMIRASREFCALSEVGLNGQLFLGGYSQGGHVTAATQREIEKNFPTEFDITAVACGSGPFDISETSKNRLLEEKPTNSMFLAFVMTSYQYVYENLWNNPSEAFVPPYDSIIPRYFDREVMVRPDPMWPDTAVRMLTPAFVQSIANDSTHPANLALKDNDLLAWTPQSKMRMYYCEGDQVVPFQNTLIALSTFVANGASNVSAVSVDPNLDHTSCTLPTLISFKGWFDSQVESCIIPNLEKDTAQTTGAIDLASAPTSTKREILINKIKVFPNPASDRISIDIPEGLVVDNIEIWDAKGSFVKKLKAVFPGSPVQLDLSTLSTGIFWIKVQTQEIATYLPLLVE